MHLLEPLLQFGILGVVLAILFYAIFMVGKWFAPRIDSIIQVHTDFVQSADRSLVKMSDSVEKMTDSVEHIDKRLTNLEVVAEKQTSILSRLSNHTNNGKLSA